MGILSDLFKSNTPEEQAAAKWQAMNEQIKREESANEDLAWQKRFQNLEMRGYSPGQAEEADLKAGVAPEEAGQNPYQEPDALQRWKSQIDGMINSGDPQLQKAGLQMISQWQAKANAGEGSEAAMSQYGKMAQEMGFTPGTKPFFDQVRRLAEGKADDEKVVSPTDAAKLRYKDGSKVAPYTPISELRGKVQGFEGDNEEAVISESVYTIANDALFGENGIYNEYGDSLADLAKLTVKGNIQQFIQTDPRFKNYNDFKESTAVMLAKSFGESGALSNQDVARAMSLTPSLTGLVDSKPVARRKMAILNELVMAHQGGDPEKVAELLEVADAFAAKEEAKQEAVSDAPSGFSEVN